ncbi:hypothetical protein L195_g020282 [Trifolium pratense]|uniref:Uncharacterized protein n=1 Tax=Trifolium pratense TaxID=57577 RepID=A0A2K3N220_TRIPR|nr:hypothetical protein L195_g020282 [Trifolium pratense]
MAYRRRQGISRASTFKEEFHSSLDDPKDSDLQNGSVSSSNSSLSVQAIKASAARHQPALSFALDPSHPDYQRSTSFDAYGHDNKSGFWGVLAHKAKSMLDENNSGLQQHDTKPQTLKSYSFNTFTSPISTQPPESNKRMDNPSIRKGLDAISSSLNQLGDTFEKAYEEGKTIVENKTADLRSQIRRKGNGPEDIYQASDQMQGPSHHETQLKATRDVAMATAAKAKLLLRELKTVKADLAFAKARSSQLEEENKLLREREGSDKGLNHNDDDLIRNQLETLLAEKARLANENETYSRENRFLREIVEYHQLTMQDVVYLDEGMEEVTMDDNGITRVLSISPHALSPRSPDEVVLESTKVMFPVPEEDDKSTSDENDTPPTVSPSQHAK